MGKLAIGISLILAIYALFLHITNLYFFGNGSSRHLNLNGFKKIQRVFKVDRARSA